MASKGKEVQQSACTGHSDPSEPGVWAKEMPLQLSTTLPWAHSSGNSSPQLLKSQQLIIFNLMSSQMLTPWHWAEKASGVNNKWSCIDSEILHMCYFVQWKLQVLMGFLFVWLLFCFVNICTCAGKVRVANWPNFHATIFSKLSRVG